MPKKLTNNDGAQLDMLSPGQILQENREKYNLTRGEVADKLHLGPQTIIDLENDDYSHLNAEIYVRGYLKAYAKLVNTSEKVVIEAFEASGGYTKPQTKPLSNQHLWAHDRIIATKSQRRWIRWIGTLIVLLLIILVILWWHSERNTTVRIVEATPSVTQPANFQPLTPVKSNDEKQS